MKKSLFIITGPTGVGKTDLVLDLARHVPIEIINADSGQFYQPLTIGTAKPDWQAEITPHHGFDILTQPEQYTVVAYRTYVQALCQEIWSANKIPVLVGGSLFYIQSLFFPPKAAEEQPAMHDAPEGTWQDLYAIDPLRAHAIHPNDTYRIQRALHVWFTTARKPSSLSLVYEPLCDAHIIFLTRQKDILYQRINDRVIQMFEQGFMQEVEGLKDTAWEPFLQQKKFIGYNDILSYLNHESPEITQQELINVIQKKTRHYAKRQHTFWRMLCARIADAHDLHHRVTTATVDLTIYDYDLYISDLLLQMKDCL